MHLNLDNTRYLPNFAFKYNMATREQIESKYLYRL